MDSVIVKSDRRQEVEMVAENGANNENGKPPMPSGGAESALDMSDPKDRAMVRRFLADWPGRWSGVDIRRKEKWVKDLEEVGDLALDVARDADNPAVRLVAANTVAGVIKTAVAMEGQNQKDQLAMLERMAPTLHKHEVQGVTVIPPPVHSRING